MNPSDDELMLAVTQNNAEAYQTLVMRHQSSVLQQCEQRVGDHELAEDLTQDVFLRVFRTRHTFRPASTFKTFLAEIIADVLEGHSR